MVDHPVQRGVGKQQIELPLESYFARVHDAEAQVGKFRGLKNFLRKFNHLRRGINTRRRSIGQMLRDFGGDFAVAAADIQNVLVAAQIEPGDQFARPGMLHGGIRRVFGGVPFRVYRTGRLQPLSHAWPEGHQFGSLENHVFHRRRRSGPLLGMG